MSINTKPFFSIITGTYNSENFIEKNLISVKNQTFKNIEHVFVDGESKDNTVKFLTEYKKEADYPVKIISSPPKGISNAFNIGIENSSGNYLFFLNSDDRFADNDVLKDVNKYLKFNKELDWIYAQIKVINAKEEEIGVFPKYKILQMASPYLLKFISFIPHQAVFMKKEVFDKYGGFDEDLKVSMDAELWLRVAKKTNWKFFERVIAEFMVRKGARSSDRKHQKENQQILYQVKREYLNSFEFVIFKLLHENIIEKRTEKIIQ